MIVFYMLCLLITDLYQMIGHANNPHNPNKNNTQTNNRFILFLFPATGDTLYFRFESDGSNNDWGYKFTVTGGKLGRFDTGYMILNSIFSMSHITK